MPYTIDWRTGSPGLSAFTASSPTVAAVNGAKIEMGTNVAGASTSITAGTHALYLTSASYDYANIKTGLCRLTGDVGPSVVDPATGAKYTAFIYVGNVLFLSKRTSGTGSAANFVSNYTITGGTVPARCYIELVLTGAGTNTRTLTVNLYDATVGGFNPASPGTAFHSSSHTNDVTGQSQFQGVMRPAISGYASGTFDQYYTTEQGTALAAGALAISRVGGTFANLTLNTATGGTSPYSYALWVDGVQVATGLSAGTVAATGLTERERYSITVKVTDSAGSPVTVETNAVDVFTQPVGGEIIRIIGDSNTDPAYASATAAQKWPLLHESWLLGNFRPATTINYAVSGTTANQWANQGSGFLHTVLADAAIGGMTMLLVDIGTNDAKVVSQRTKAEYKTDISTIVSRTLADFPTCRIGFTIGPYIEPGTVWNSTSNTRMTEYVAAIEEIIAADTTGLLFDFGLSFYASSVTNKVAWGLTTADNPHYNATGHTAKQSAMRSLWTDAALPSGGSGGGSLINGGLIQ